MQQLTESNHVPVRLESKGALPAIYPESGYGGSYGNRLDPGSQPANGGLLEYWRILSRRKGTLILITSIGAVMGFLATLPQTPIYQARTSLEIVGLNQNFLNIKEASPLDEGGASSNAVDIQTQVKILQSEALIDQVLGKLHVPTDADQIPSQTPAWRKALNLPDAQPEDPRLQAIKYAKKNYKVRTSGQTRIIEVTVDSMNAQIAADFANVLANEFIEQSLEARWKTTERTGQFLTRQIDDMRVRLEASEDKLQHYARMAGLLFTEDKKTNISEQKLTQVQLALSAAQSERISKQSRWEMANSSSPEALPDILNDLALREYQTKLTELRRQMAEQRSTYTAENSKVKRIEAQLAPIQAAYDRERSDILTRIHNEFDEALRKETLLAAEYGTQRSLVTGEGEKAIQYNILKREVDSNRQLYDAMLQQLKQASLASALRASNIRVVDQATRPKRPYKPDILLGSGLGLMSGLFFGAAFLVMRERADRSIQEPGETAMYLDLPELGVIPADKLGTRIRVRFAGNKDRAENGAEPLESAPGLPQRVELVTWQRKPSMVAESFRAALVSILFSGDNGNRPHVLVVTSCGPGDGKSTVASNLGIAVAEVNQKVLLIDADMRKPRLHDIFGLKNNLGLSDLLQSTDSPAVLPPGIIQETSVSNLYVLPSGKTTAAATSLLYSGRLPELLKALRSEFETIIIDSPPMLQIPDARVVGRMVDRVIMVVRAGKTTRDAVMAANQKFAEDGTKVLGTILNDWNPKKSPGGYYGYYNGYYNSYYKHGYGVESKKA
jgi:polysaccharide biosynthesis transport protein